jgi:hypothetical protein
MWSARTESFAQESVVKIDRDNHPITCSDAFRAWQEDDEFRSFFIRLLADAPYSAFRWETPPITTASLGRAFEFALVDSPELETRADPDAFAKHFNVANDNQVVSFANLSGDAILIVPCPVSADFAYAHVAAFVRNAPDAQKHALWSLVGRVMEDNVSEDPVWLSTAGAGVPWLHVRIDQRPKYYCHAEYRKRS